MTPSATSNSTALKVTDSMVHLSRSLPICKTATITASQPSSRCRSSLLLIVLASALTPSWHSILVISAAMDLSTYPILTAPPQTPKSLTASIPLRCNICPKKPGFSDISHLLTHIASKAHLSTYYKIKVRSGQEDASRLVIDEYDAWYARYRIEDLMSERMNLKEHKRKQKARQASNGEHDWKTAETVY